MNIKKLLYFTDEQIISGGCINERNDDHPRVYFLIKDDVVIYVGQTINLGRRVSSHSRSKDFDLISYLSIPDHLINDVEVEYIVRFNPEDNNALHSNTLYCGSGKLKSLVKDQFDTSMQDATDSMEVIYTSKTAHIKYVKIEDCVKLSRRLSSAIKEAIDDCIEMIGE